MKVMINKTITQYQNCVVLKYTILASINDAFKSKDICSDVINERQNKWFIS